MIGIERYTKGAPAQSWFTNLMADDSKQIHAAVARVAGFAANADLSQVSLEVSIVEHRGPSLNLWIDFSREGETGQARVHLQEGSQGFRVDDAVLLTPPTRTPR